MNGLKNKALSLTQSMLMLAGILLFATSASAAPKRGWQKHNRIENKVAQLEARKEAIELLQDRADQKVGGHRAEIIKNRLEHQQDVIDNDIKRLRNKQERIQNRYRPRYHPRSSSAYYYNNRPRNVYYRPRNYNYPRGNSYYRPRCESRSSVGGSIWQWRRR